MEDDTEKRLIAQMSKTGWKYSVDDISITFVKEVSEEERWVYVFVKETGKFMYFNSKERRK